MNRDELTAVIDRYVRAGLPMVFPTSLTPSIELAAREAYDVLDWAHNFGAEPFVRVEIQDLTRTIRQDLYVTVHLDDVPVMIRYSSREPIAGGPDATLVVVTP